MEQQVEISDFDLRYQGYRIRNQRDEKQLLQGILENGILDPLQGVDNKDTRILLNGFKRLRCAQKLGIAKVPYDSLSNDEVVGILQLMRISNTKSLTILEQAKLIKELMSVYQLSNVEIARSLGRSKAWVSVRSDLLKQLSPYIMKQIMSGAFPAYSYMYTLRPFMRINKTPIDELDRFVKSVSAQGLSTRQINTLAQAYFKGRAEMRQQIEKGKSHWALEQLKLSSIDPPDCSQIEQMMLQNLTRVQKYMGRIITQPIDDQYISHSFYAQANLLSGGILKSMDSFLMTVKQCHDRSRQT